MERLIRAYRDNRLILFIGAGVSMSLGLPSWPQLIDDMANEMGFDPAIYRTYGNELTLAEYYRLTKGHYGTLRSAIDREWHTPTIDIGQSRIHELIASLKVDLIYTTNFDHWLERSFDHWGRPYSKIVSVDDMVKAPFDRTQIVKFHGDFIDDTTLVLGEASYFDRMQFESPLDIKLRSDVLGRSVLFIGYSLTDPNIRLLFYKLAQLWKQSTRGAPPTSFIFSDRPNPVHETTLAQWNIQMLHPSSDDKTQALITLLEELHSA